MSLPVEGASRVAEGGKAASNRLAREPSLYLRQHGHNPVDWYPWGQEALDLARREDRPIFLSIGYASCHWCHVMAHQVFEDPEVAALMNREFVCIKVDREERPDLDAVYMEAVQAMTGHGGWPLSVFLTPAGMPFFGGTYFPRSAFLEIAARVHEVFCTRRAGIERDGARLRALVAADLQRSERPPLELAELARVAGDAVSRCDPEWGGLVGRQKFPTPLRWRFLLHRFRHSGDARVAEVLRRTLDAMGSGGIHDHVGGGFHRYTVEPTWLVPHFEKMLYDNAQLAALYTEAAQVFQAPRYREIARGTLDFMLRELRGEEAAFYASLDADSGGEEGRYYLWTPAKLRAVTGDSDGDALAALLGVTDEGNFEGSNVLSRRVDPAVLAAQMGWRPQEVAALFDRWREPLRRAREQRVAPGLDRKVVTAWNGLAIEALAGAAQVFAEPRYLAAAAGAADYLWQVHRLDDGGLRRSSTAGVAANPAILDDYAFVACGLLALFQASGEPRHLSRALALMDVAIERFSHPEGAFYLTPRGGEAPLGRAFEVLDAVEPSGNAAMLHALLRAAALTGDEDYRARAEQMLSSFATLMGRAGVEMAAWLDAAELSAGPFYQVVIAGAPADAGTESLRRVYGEVAPAHAVLVQVGVAGAREPLLSSLPSLQGKVAHGGQATAYVCQRGACMAPTSDPAELRRQLLAGWSCCPPPGQ